MAELPKTPAGKVNRKVLREREPPQPCTRSLTEGSDACSTPPQRSFPKITEKGLDELRKRIGVKIGVTRRAVVLRGHARQHPPLRPRHRRRQPAVVRSRLRGEDQVRRHHRAAELPVRDQPHHLRLCRRPAGRARHVGGRRLDLAQAGAAQRRDLDRGLAEGPGRAPDALRRPRDPADLPRRLLQPAGRPGGRGRQLVLPHRARPRARAGHQVQGGEGARRRAATPTRSSPRPTSSTPSEEIRGATPRYWQDVTEGEALPTMVKGPMTVTGFIAYAQGWGGLYIRANKLAWKLHRRASRPRHQEPLRHSRLPRARALGGGLRARGRRARRLRLRPGALLVADPPPHQLDGRRRLPAPRAPARSAATTRRATCCSSRAR